MSRSTFRGIVVALALTAAAPASAADFQTRIVGGTTASTVYPAQAQLFAGGAFICGGTLVSRTKVVTAAHCVTEGGFPLLGIPPQPVAPSARSVRLGSNTMFSGEAFTLSSIVAHPDYRSENEANDVAVLTLSRAASQAPLPLADPVTDAASYAVGVMGRVIGWGATVFEGPGSMQLREVDVPVVSDPACGDAYADLEPAVQICAGEEGRDSCQGDSGGPLMSTADGTFKLTGVVSAGFECGSDGFPGIYTELVAPGVRSFVIGQTGPPPTVTIADPGLLAPGQTTTLTASGTGIASLAWDLDADGVFDDATGPTAAFTAPASGAPLVRVLVRNADAMGAADERSLSVGTAPPAPPPTPPPSPPAPNVVTPPPVVPQVPTPRGAPRLTLSARGVRGRLRVSGRVAGAGCAGGRVQITTTRRGRRVARATVTLRGDCRFARNLRGSGRLRIEVTFLGTAELRPITMSKTRVVRRG